MKHLLSKIFKTQPKHKIFIIENDGSVNRGYARQMQESKGFCISTESGMLEAFGLADGTFPLGNPWNWHSFAFVNKVEE